MSEITLNVTFYFKPDDAACEEVRTQLASLQEKFPHRLIEIDIEQDAALAQKYGADLPAIEAGPYTLKAPITPQALHMTLGAAFDRHGQLERVGDPKFQKRVAKMATLSFSDRFSFWISKHYLLLLNLFIFLYIGLPFLAPTLMKLGATLPAKAIYNIYKPLCHQFGFRSFFLYGEQPFYPLAEANLNGTLTFEQATGIQGLDNPYSNSRFEARAFLGNETMGYKIALCERDVAIYLAILFFGLFYAASGRKLKPLHWTLWILIGIVPIGLDGFSQLFSQLNWGWLEALLPYRESTPFMRALTGALFGLATAWFAYPSIEESMIETRQYYLKKFTLHGAE
ncbi:MAG: DUF2085 domain-containing protein [Anaerolineales bacterium]|nr:DUF2085 domain-containing protein [Anaerolineales bacterium]